NKISAYVGKKGQGLPVCTIVRGKVIAQDGKLTDSKGFGKFITKTKQGA
ncbi:allantoinase AllB, partial [Mannheimia haemolytica]